MAKKTASGPHKVTFSGVVKVADKRGKPVTAPGVLQLLDGFIHPNCLIPRLYDEYIDRDQLSGGYMRCEYDELNGAMLFVEFSSKKMLSGKRFLALKKECPQRWTKEQAFAEFTDLTGFTVDTELDPVKVTRSRGRAFKPNAKAVAHNKALLTLWKQSGGTGVAPVSNKEMALKCFEAIDRKSVGGLKRLLKVKFDLNRVMPDTSSEYHEETLLSYASKGSSPKVVEALLKAGADPNATGSDGVPLQSASNPAIVSLLLEHG